MATKQPYEAYTFTYDFAAELGTDTIAGVDEVTSSGPDSALVNQAQSNTATAVLVRWGAGTNGANYYTTVRITTASGDKFERDGLISVFDAGVQPGPTPAGPYAEPTAADLKARYPAFVAVDNATIAYWLSDAHRFVDTSWFDEDYGPALIAAAAHNMARARVAGLAEDLVGSIAATGATSFKSGTFSATFSESAAAQASSGGWGSTPYGQDYLDALYRNKSGFGTTSPGSTCCAGGYRDRPIP